MFLKVKPTPCMIIIYSVAVFNIIQTKTKLGRGGGGGGGGGGGERKTYGPLTINPFVLWDGVHDCVCSPYGLLVTLINYFITKTFQAVGRLERL